MTEIIFTEKITEDLDVLVGQGFEEHSAEHGLNCDYNEFAFIAKENGETVGAVLGNVYFSEVHISELIVAKSHRGMDIGTKLIQAVAERYSGGRYECISLTTHRFQAPKFYEKCGFETEFIRKSRIDPKQDKFFMVKYFDIQK